MVKTNPFEDPEYWKGNKGYKGIGYSDFIINTVKEIAVLSHRPKSVLEIGCAYGFSVKRINQLGIACVGLEISKLAISRAEEDVRPALIHGTVWDMPFLDGQYDLCYCSGVLEHVPYEKLARATHEIQRVCKRGIIGVACIDDETTHLEDDTTHEVILPVKEWQSYFKPEFIILSDSENSWRSYTTIRIAEVMANERPLPDTATELSA